MMKALFKTKSGQRFGRRLGAVCVVGAVAAMALFGTGCSSEKAQEGVGGGGGETAALTYYYPGGLTPADAELVNQRLSDLTKEKINVTVKFERFDWNTYDQKISSMVAAGEEFDLLYTSDYVAPYLQYAQKGAYRELSELLDQYGQGIQEAVDPMMLEACKVNGKGLYTIPVNKEHAHSAGVLFRKDLVEKYGIDVSGVKTLADLEAVLDQAKSLEPELYPLKMGQNEGMTPLLNFNILSGNSAVPGALPGNNDSSKIINQYAGDEYMELARTARRFYEKGFIRPDAATKSTGNTVETQFAQIAVLKPGKDKEMADGEYEYIQAELTEPVFASSDATGAMAAVSRTCKNPEAAMKLLYLMYTDANFLNLLYYGVEDKHYTTDADGRVALIPDSGYAPGSQWMFGNQMISKIKNNEDADKWEKIKAFNEKATVLDSIGFTFDQTNVKTEIGACVNVVAEYKALIHCGAADPEVTVAELNTKLKEAGADRIIAEIQKQYDEFLQGK